MPAAAALCIALVGGAPVARLPADSFTLAWTHSVERIEWREDWRLTDGLLMPETARVRGSGAGMEVPEGAELRDGWWVYKPATGPLDRLDLANSSFTQDYRLCITGTCRKLAKITGIRDRPVSLFACPGP